MLFLSVVFLVLFIVLRRLDINPYRNFEFDDVCHTYVRAATLVHSWHIEIGHVSDIARHVRP